MKKLYLLAALLLCGSFVSAQILDKIKKKAEDKVIQKAEDALAGKKNKPTDKQSEQAESGEENDMQVKRKFDFVPGNKVLYEEDFSGAEEGTPPSNWKFSGTAEVATLNKIPGKWMMLNHSVWATRELNAPFPENCTIKFDLFTSNANYLWKNGEPSPTFAFFVGNDKNNEIRVDITYYGSSVYYWVNGLNNTENRLDFNLSAYKNRPLPVRIAVNQQRLRIWLNETKIVDLQEVVSRKTLQSGILKFYCDRADRESYPFVSNIRIADAGLTERDLSVGAAEPTKTTTAKQTQTKSQSTTTRHRTGLEFYQWHEKLLE